jgi:hypothetical protein
VGDCGGSPRSVIHYYSRSAGGWHGAWGIALALERRVPRSVIGLGTLTAYGGDGCWRGKFVHNEVLDG